MANPAWRSSASSLEKLSLTCPIGCIDPRQGVYASPVTAVRPLLTDRFPTLTCVLRLISLPTSDQLAAAHDPTPADRRELTIVELIDDRGRSGFGECSALTRVGYTHEWARGAFDQLLATRGAVDSNAPMAAAAIEMARLDLGLHDLGMSLAARLREHSRHRSSEPVGQIDAGIVLPLASTADTLAAAGRWSEQGIRRIKLKIEPGRVLSCVAAVHEAFPDLELHVDANGSCSESEFDELAQLDRHGVTAVEQPFAVTDSTLTSTLSQATTALVVADESATDLTTIARLIEERIVTGVVIKPGRLGGLETAVAVHDLCVDAGVPVSAGGMLESGLGRHALAALAALPGFTIIGDVSPARRWLAADPFADLELSHGQITVPTGPGVVPAPDVAMLDQLTVERAEFDITFD